MTNIIIPYSNNCPCGSVYIPIGSKHNAKGLSLRLYYEDTSLDLKLIHNSDSFLSSEQIFVTSTEKITLNQTININKILLICDSTYSLIVNDSINIVIKNFDTKEVLFNKIFGSKGESFAWDTNILQNKTSLSIENNNLSRNFNLFNTRLQLEIHSLCSPFDVSFCCNNNPITMSVDNVVSNIDLICCQTTTTTTTPLPGLCCERGARWNPQTITFERYSECLGIMSEVECNPQQGFEAERIWIPSGQCVDCTIDNDFCSSFHLPSSFNITVVGHGIFFGQETEVTVHKNGNYYTATGSFPCGDNFSVSMTCDLLSEEFSYDGYIGCCDQSTKWVHDNTKTPLLYPNARVSDIIVDYLSCSGCVQCTSTTSTTTKPPLPCEDTDFGSIILQGYAFYRKNNNLVNIPGVGDIEIDCTGGHTCNRTNFLPQLILNNVTIDGQPINVNNAPTGEDRDAVFSFNVPNITLLKDGASIRLQCLDDNCHTGITAIVLTATMNGTTKILFNSCVLPDETRILDICECPIGSRTLTHIETNTPTGLGNCIPKDSKSFLVSIPPEYSMPVKILIRGGVDDDIKINGQLIEQGLYPYLYYQCNGAHSIGTANGGNGYVFMNYSHSFIITIVDNFGGYSGMEVDIIIDPDNDQNICLPPTISVTTTTTPAPSGILSTYIGPDILTYTDTKKKINISSISVDTMTFKQQENQINLSNLFIDTMIFNNNNNNLNISNISIDILLTNN